MVNSYLTQFFPITMSHHMQVYHFLVIMKDLGSAFPAVAHSISQSPLHIHLQEYFSELPLIFMGNRNGLFPWLSDFSLIFHLIDLTYLSIALSPLS